MNLLAQQRMARHDRLMKLPAAIFGLILAIGTMASASVDEGGEPPTQTSVAQIISDPWAWHGRMVRLRGYTFDCYRLGCSICDAPGEFDYEHCLGFGEVGFDDQAKGPDGLPAERYLATRWAEITLTGRYDAECSMVPQPGSVGRAIMFCGDWFSMLQEPVIEAIHAYRRAETMGGVPALLRVEDPVLIVVARAYLNSTPFFSDGDPDEFALLSIEQYDNEDRGWQSGFVACRCDQETCEGSWPQALDETWLAIGNPYTCIPFITSEDIARFAGGR